MAEDHDELRRISAALDGDGPLPDDLSPQGRAFLAGAGRLRSLARLEEAAVPPDVADAVLARIGTTPAGSGEPRGPAAVPAGRARRPRPLATAAAAAFVVAALAAAALVRPGGPLGPEPALADVGGQVLEAQARIDALDATVTLQERGAHPDLPLRSYAGTLRYEAPERLWLHLEDRTPLPPGWVANHSDLVVDDGSAWTAGLLDCPVGEQPGCLRTTTRAVTGLVPFSAGVVAPLDLVIPAGAFLPATEVASSARDGSIVVDTTVARVHDTVEGLRWAGALRSVHPTDAVRLELDDEAFTIRRLTVVAGDTPARAAWAASHGYGDGPGTPVLDLTVTPTTRPAAAFPGPAGPADQDAGFADGPVTAEPAPAWLPPGFGAHRSGTHASGGPRVASRSWSNGRAWIRLDVTSEHTGAVLFGGLGPIVREIQVGPGTGYTDPTGTIVSLRAEGLDLAVTGSVPLADLARVAASIPVRGETLPPSWPQGQVLDEVPRGALRPGGDLIARYDGVDLLVAIPGPGQTSAVLRQRPGSSLGPAARTDVTEVEVRGVLGRYEARAQLVAWVEDGWVRELRSEGLDLDELLAVIEDLRP